MTYDKIAIDRRVNGQHLGCIEMMCKVQGMPYSEKN